MSYDIISYIGVEKSDWDRGLIEVGGRAQEIANRIDNTMNRVLKVGTDNFREAGQAANIFGGILNTIKNNMQSGLRLEVENRNAIDKINEINRLVNNIKTRIDIDVNYRERGRPAPVASKEGNYFGEIPKFAEGGVLALLHPPEVVIGQETTKKYTPGQWDAFNKTGDSSVLGNRGGFGMTSPEVHIHAEYVNPESVFTIWDQNYNPRKNYVERYLEGTGHPYI